MIADSQSVERHELLRRIMLVKARATQVMTEADLEPGSIHEYPEGNDFVMAFGYVERPEGRGSRQRYLEIRVPGDGYLTMGVGTQDGIIEQLRAKLGDLIDAQD